MNNIINNYQNEINKAMRYLATKDNTIFLGQSVLYGDGVYRTLLDIPSNKKIEMPVAEEMQMGISIGLALNGYVPITIYPRMDFIILSMNQLVNHLDKLEELSKGIFKPKVIIRCIIGSQTPLYPGLQHCQDHTNTLKTCLQNINVVKLTNIKMIMPEYKKALKSKKSTILVEIKDLYETTE